MSGEELSEELCQVELFIDLFKRIRAMPLEKTLRICGWVFLSVRPVSFLMAGGENGKHAIMIPSRGSSTVGILTLATTSA